MMLDRMGQPCGWGAGGGGGGGGCGGGDGDGDVSVMRWGILTGVKPALSPFALMFRREQRCLGDAQPGDDEQRGEQGPEDEVDDEWRVDREMQPKRERQHDSADDHDQEGCRAIADIERGEIEPAAPASVSKADWPGKQRALSAFGAQAAQRRACDCRA